MRACVRACVLSFVRVCVRACVLLLLLLLLLLLEPDNVDKRNHVSCGNIIVSIDFFSPAQEFDILYSNISCNKSISDH